MTERTSTEQSRLSGAGASLRQSVVPEIRAVLFDMDGVLVDSERLIAEAAKRMFADHYGLEVKLEDFVPFVGAGENRYLGGVAENGGLFVHREEPLIKVPQPQAVRNLRRLTQAIIQLGLRPAAAAE